VELYFHSPNTSSWDRENFTFIVTFSQLNVVRLTAVKVISLFALLRHRVQTGPRARPDAYPMHTTDPQFVKTLKA